jgi:hypothetical protein
MLRSFPALVTFLQQNLPTTSLSNLRSTTALDSLIDACMSELLGLRSTPVSAGGITASFGGGTPDKQQVNLSNKAWRSVTLIQQYKDANGTDIANSAAVALDPMAGATRSSFGTLSLIGNGTTGDPTTTTIALNLTGNPAPATVVLWVRGLGRKSGSEPPDAVKAFPTKNSTEDTVKNYVLFPFLDIVAGINGAFAGDIYSLVKLGTNDLPDLETAIAAGDTAAIKVMVTDIFATLTQAILKIGVKLGLSEFLAAVIGAASLAFGLANAFEAANTWLHYSDTASLELIVSSAGVIIQ